MRQLLPPLDWKNKAGGNVTRWSGHGHPAEGGTIGLCPWVGAGVMEMLQPQPHRKERERFSLPPSLQSPAVRASMGSRWKSAAGEICGVSTLCCQSGAGKRAEQSDQEPTHAPC